MLMEEEDGGQSDGLTVMWSIGRRNNGGRGCAKVGRKRGGEGISDDLKRCVRSEVVKECGGGGKGVKIL